MVRIGQGSYIGIGVVSGSYVSPDSLYGSKVGTAADIKLWFRAQEDTDQIQFERDVVQFPEVTSYDPPIESAIEGQKRVTGSLNFATTWEYFIDLMRLITGHNVSQLSPGEFIYDPVEPSNSAHYLFGTVPRWLVVEVFRGDKSVSPASVYYQGFLPTNIQFQLQGNQFVQVQMEGIGSHITVSQKSTPSFGSLYMKTPTGQTVQTFMKLYKETSPTEGKHFICRTARIRFNQPLEHRYDVADVVPSAMPLPNAKREVTVEAEIEAEDTDSIVNGWMQHAENPVDKRFRKIEVLLVHDASNEILFTLHHVTLQPPVEPRVAGIGVLRANFTGMAHASVSTRAYGVKVKRPFPTAYQ